MHVFNDDIFESHAILSQLAGAMAFMSLAKSSKLFYSNSTPSKIFMQVIYILYNNRCYYGQQMEMIIIKMMEEVYV